ncbi:hypothetical protein [Acinetobacter soli]|uniref:hypothetical protein n=2 Tax=Moraxellaceae TaxID=468 RepID=UPI0005A82942|nr:hypothetical protein [Acinetobacter soli]
MSNYLRINLNKSCLCAKLFSKGEVMKSKMSKEDFLSILSGLFDAHTGNSHFDEEAWLEDWEKGKDPVAAFYDEYPEYDDL